jgi:hypothetical protein
MGKKKQPVLGNVEAVDITPEEDAQRSLELRRSLEFELMKRCDKTTIDPRIECWFMVSADWLSDWSAFMNAEAKEGPGPISNMLLFEEGSKKKIRSGLEAKLDYRCVPPLVFYILSELYGTDPVPAVCRYSLDIYSPQVPVIDLVRIQEAPMIEAKYLVADLRRNWTVYDQDEEVEEDLNASIVCGLTREHIESILYWVASCCTRGKHGRKTIRYRDYRPLSKGNEELSDDGDDGDDEDDEESGTKGYSIGDAERGHKTDIGLRSWMGG